MSEELSNITSEPFQKIGSITSFILNLSEMELGQENRSKIIGHLTKIDDTLPYLGGVNECFDKVVCVAPKLDNNRVTHQHAAFFLFGIKDGKRQENSELSVLNFRMTIKRECKKKILKQLELLGINEPYCFPEIDNVAHYLNGRDK